MSSARRSNLVSSSTASGVGRRKRSLTLDRAHQGFFCPFQNHNVCFPIIIYRVTVVLPVQVAEDVGRVVQGEVPAGHAKPWDLASRIAKRQMPSDPTPPLRAHHSAQEEGPDDAGVLLLLVVYAQEVQGPADLLHVV